MKSFLDFFVVADWFGRPGPYTFSLERIVLVALCVVACILIPILIKKNIAKARVIIFAFWIFALVLDIIKYVFYNTYCIIHKLNIDKFELPLWTCTIYLFALPFGLFNKNEKIRNACNAFICSISMLGGFINFLFPTESVFSFMGLHTLLYHFILLITPIIMLSTGYYKPEFKHFVGAMIIFLIYSVPVFIIDNIFAIDYMFIYNGTWFGPMSIVAELMPHRLLWTFVCVLGHIGVMALMIYIESRLIKIDKNKK